MKQKSPRILTFSDRVYRGLLFLYPADHRQEYGPLMAQAFHDLGRDALQIGGIFRLARLWLGTLPDVAVTTMNEHLEKKERKPMNKPMEKVGLIFLAIAFVVYLIAAVALSFEAEDAWAGAILLLVIAGSVLLLFQAIKDRLGNKEDDYYAKNVAQ